MKVTFSNGVEFEAISVIENIDAEKQSILLDIRMNEKIDLDTVFNEVINGIDKITVTYENDKTEVFTGYKKIAFVQNIINETSFESSIGVSKPSTIE